MLEPEQAVDDPTTAAMPVTGCRSATRVRRAVDGCGHPSADCSHRYCQIAVPQEAGPLALREAAAVGDAIALFEVGARYVDGRGVKSDMKQAAAWYEKSAELGFAPAQYRIGNLYEKAVGVDRDISRAKSWYRKSADQGNASAMHNLAVLYAMGADGTTDNQSAAKWFTAAAELGVKDSQFNLGILARQGHRHAEKPQAILQVVRACRQGW